MLHALAKGESSRSFVNRHYHKSVFTVCPTGHFTLLGFMRQQPGSRLPKYMMMMKMKLPILPCAEKLELVLSTKMVG